MLKKLYKWYEKSKNILDDGLIYVAYQAAVDGYSEPLKKPCWESSLILMFQ